MRADSVSVRWCATRSWSAIEFKLAAVNGPTPVAQYCAIAVCSAVRVSEIERTSANAERNAGDPNAGGGGGRSWLAELRKKGRTPCSDRTIDAPLDTQYPGPTGGVPGDTTR